LNNPCARRKHSFTFIMLPPLNWLIPILSLFNAKSVVLFTSLDQQFEEAVAISKGLTVVVTTNDEDLIAYIGSATERVFVMCDLECLRLIPLHDLGARRMVWMVTSSDVSDYEALDLFWDSMLLSYEQNLNDSFSIYEHYGFDSEVKVKSLLGHVSSSQWTSEEPQYIWERRSDLKGVTLRNLAIHWRELNDLQEWGNPKGFFPDVINVFKSKLNFSVDNIKPTDGTWGIFNETSKKWGGIIGDLAAGKAHMACTGVTANAERFAAVDFTFRVVEEVATLIMPKEAIVSGSGVTVQAYLSVYKMEAQIGYLIIILLAIPIITLVSGPTRSFSDMISKGPRTIAFIFLTLIQRDTDLLSSTLCLSPKILLMSVSLLNYMMYQLYVNDLTAQITAANNDMQITSFQYLLDNKFTLYLSRGRIYNSIVMNAPEDSAMANAYNEITMFVEDVTDCNDSFDLTDCWYDFLQTSPKSTLFSTSLRTRKDVEVLYNLKEAATYPVVIAMPKDSDLTSLFNYNIIKMYQSGLLRRMQFEGLDGGRPKEWTQRIFVKESQPPGLDNVYFPNFILLGGLVIALGLVVIEVIARKLQKG